jgi:hypothetical protein
MSVDSTATDDRWRRALPLRSPTATQCCGGVCSWRCRFGLSTRVAALAAVLGANVARVGVAIIAPYE